MTSTHTSRRIDAHIHVQGNHPETIAMLDRLNLTLVNISFGTDNEGLWRHQGECPLLAYRELGTQFPEQFRWLTGIDLPRFDDPQYAARVIAQLDTDFDAGAVGCKVWKNIGMEVRKPSGEFLMVDDAVFVPIFEHLGKIGQPLLIHIGDPYACWRPLDEPSPHQAYYRDHPEWHLYDKPEYPSHKQLITARDRVTERHPNLCVVGAHLGSLEHDVGEVAKRFDRYPNFFVDVSARIHDLARQDADQVRRFFLDYSDRILFGTDHVELEAHLALTADQRTQRLQTIESMYATQFTYYESDGATNLGGRRVQCLALPQEVLDKFYTHNALRCYPGLG